MDFAAHALTYLAEASLRAAALAAVAVLSIALLRPRSAATRHAMWTAVLAGMVLLSTASPWMPPLKLPILKAESAPASSVPALPAPAPAPIVISAPPRAVPNTAAIHFVWSDAAFLVYVAIASAMLIRLAAGLLFVRRLVRASVPIEAASELRETAAITVPMTVGLFRPRILLPAAWRDWPASKLDAALAHERAHVARADWAILIVGAVNRAVFWFHPLAWYLQRRLAALAEEACDDAALLAADSRESYAQALLEIAAAVRPSHGRVFWEAIAMARNAEVTDRVNRILDESRPIPQGMTTRNWMALAACALPVIGLAAALEFAPRARAQATQPPATQTQPPGFVPPAQRPGAGRGPMPMVTAQTAVALEQQLQINPEDLNARTRLVEYYFRSSLNAQRVAHVEWIIQHHPESPVLRLMFFRIEPHGVHNDPADFENAANLWRAQQAAHSGDPDVTLNANAFFNQSVVGASVAQNSQPATGRYSVTAMNMPANFIDAADVPQLLSSPAPIYPSEALQSNISGVVELIVTLGTNGRPNDLRTFSGPAVLMKAAMTAMWQWTWAPYIKDGVPEPVSFLVQVPFGAGAGSPQAAPPTGSGETAAMPLVKRVPVYPPSARASGASGAVELYATITPEGKVANPKVLKSLGSAFDEAALQAVLGWRFQPATKNGQPVAQTIAIDVNFPPR